VFTPSAIELRGHGMNDGEHFDANVSVLKTFHVAMRFIRNMISTVQQLL
jgi:hypothetical protein